MKTRASNDSERQLALNEIARGKSEVRELVKERGEERATIATLSRLGVDVTREDLQRAKTYEPAAEHRDEKPRKKARRATGAAGTRPTGPTVEQIDSLWRDLEALVREWLPDWMDGLSLGDDGALVREISRTIRALGPVREHTADTARLLLKEGIGRLGAEMLYLTDRVIPLQWQRDRATDSDADLAYLKARRAADLRAAALRRVAERLHHTESLVLLICGRGGSTSVPVPYAYITAEVGRARPKRQASDGATL